MAIWERFGRESKSRQRMASGFDFCLVCVQNFSSLWIDCSTPKNDCILDALDAGLAGCLECTFGYRKRCDFIELRGPGRCSNWPRWWMSWVTEQVNTWKSNIRCTNEIRLFELAVQLLGVDPRDRLWKLNFASHSARHQPRSWTGSIQYSKWDKMLWE